MLANHVDCIEAKATQNGDRLTHAARGETGAGCDHVIVSTTVQKPGNAVAQQSVIAGATKQGGQARTGLQAVIARAACDFVGAGRHIKDVVARGACHRFIGIAACVLQQCVRRAPDP